MKLYHHDNAARSESPTSGALVPGRSTRTEVLPASGNAQPVQRSQAPALVEHEDPFAMHLIGPAVQMTAGADGSGDVHGAASHGISGPADALPFLDRIQRSFGAEHDVSQIQAHVGGAAAEGSAAMGAEAFATGNHVAFSIAPDLHLAAHEAAHVVQQRGAVQLAGGVGAEGDQYEQHADRVADAVVRGESAAHLLQGQGRAGSAATQRSPVQRFGSKEHKLIGDEATDATYEMGGVRLTHGDIIALSGDLFTPDELSHLMASPASAQEAPGYHNRYYGRLAGTDDEIVYALYKINPADERFQKGGIWSKHEFSTEVKRKVDTRYFRLAAHNDDHFASPQGAGSERALGAAGGTYRQHHEKALVLAYMAGRGDSLPRQPAPVTFDQAMITEAAAQHYLTDSFAAGHLTTARTSVGAYWNAKYPEFGTRFVDKLVRDLSRELKRGGTGMPGMIPRGMIEGGVQGQIAAQLAGKPLPRLGDLISLVMHDHDNAAGLIVENDVGDTWRAFGDGGLVDPVSDGRGGRTGRNLDMVIRAVQLGNEDVRVAFSLGQSHQHAALDDEQIFDLVRQQASAPAKAGEKYGAEQLVPRVVGESVYQWQVESLAVLWDTPIREGSDVTFGKMLHQSAVAGTLKEELVAMQKSLPTEQDPFFASYGELYPKEAFTRAVLEVLADKDQCREYLLEVAGP